MNDRRPGTAPIDKYIMRINEEFIDNFGDDVIQNQDAVEVDDSERELPYIFFFEGTECGKNKKLPAEYIRRLIRFHSMACKYLTSNPYVKDFVKHFRVYVGKSADLTENECYDFKVTDDITVWIDETDAKIDRYNNKHEGYFNSLYDYLASKRPCRPTVMFYIDANVSSLDKISKLLISIFDSFRKCYKICFEDLGSYDSWLKFRVTNDYKHWGRVNSSTIEYWKSRSSADINLFANSYIAFNPDCSMKNAKRIADEFCIPKNDEQLMNNYIRYFDKNNIRLIRDLQDDLKSNMEMVDKTLVLRPQRQYHLWRGRPQFLSIRMNSIRFVYESYIKNLFKIKIEGLEYVELCLDNEHSLFETSKSRETLELASWFVKNILSDDITGLCLYLYPEVCCEYIDKKMNLVELFPGVKEIHVSNNYITTFSVWEDDFIDVPVIRDEFKVNFITPSGEDDIIFRPND